MSDSRMNRRDFLKAIAAGASVSLIPDYFFRSHPARGQSRPNVLLLITDQHRADAMGCLDGSYITPNMDRFAESGVRFTNCFCTSPLCSPSRASLMTGRPPDKTGVKYNGVPLSLREMTIAEVFSNKGYQTSYFGKWHLGRSPSRHGFDYVGTSNPQLVGDEVLTREVLDYILGNLDPSRPFFMVVSWIWPHNPRRLVREYSDDFPLDSMKVPRNFNDDLTDKPGWYRDRAMKYGLNRLKVRRRSRVYRTMVRQVDEWVGQVQNAIENLGLMDNTIVAYTSDHGEMMGSHRLRGKVVAFDESIRVPFLLRVPGTMPARRIVDDLLSNATIPGTLIEAAGLEVPRRFLGGSALSSLFSLKHPVREAVFFEYLWTGPYQNYYRGIRTRRMKYVEHRDDKDELYDLARDPREMRNLIDSEAYRSKISLLKARLDGRWG